MKDEEIIIHKNQSTLDDYLKEENKLCLNCNDNINSTCNSITCDYFGMAIKDIDLTFCLNQDKKNKSYDDSLFEE